MSIEDIIVLPNPILRKPSITVTKVDAAIKELVSKMLETCSLWEKQHPHELCVGLAAIQIAEPQAIFLVRNDEKTKNFAVLINPRSVKKSGKIERDYEGCLSVDGLYGLVPRHTQISLRALDADGREHQTKCGNSGRICARVPRGWDCSYSRAGSFDGRKPRHFRLPRCERKDFECSF